MATPGAIRAGRAYVALFADDAQLMRGLKKARYKLRRWGASVRALGMKMLGVSSMMAAPFVAGTRAFADFEESMAKVSTMLDRPRRHMERFRESVLGLSGEFGQATGTIADGLYDILSAQVPATRALDYLREGLRGAVAGNTEAKIAISALLTVMEAYGDELTGAGDAMDFLFSVVKRGRLTFGELAQNLGKVAPTAAAAHVSLEEFGAALALVTRGMPDTERATTALANVIEMFLMNTDEAKQAAARLGIEMSSAGLKSQGLLYVIRKLAKVDPDTVAKIFPRRRALRGLIIAVQKAEQLGVDIQTMANRAGAAETAYRKMADTLGHSFRQLYRTGMAALIRAGEALAPALRKVTERLKGAGRDLERWIRLNQSSVVSTAKWIAKLAAAGAALVVLGTTISSIGSIITGVIATVTAAKAAFHGLQVAVSAAAAHPVIAAVGALAAVTVSLAYAMERAQIHTARLADEKRRLLVEGDMERREHRAQIQRLEQLAAKEKLSTDEKKEARRIIGDLEGHYGTLGARVDETAGKIEGMAAALRALNGAMAGWTTRQIHSRIDELRDNISELRTESRSLLESGESLLSMLTGYGPGLTEDEVQQRVEQIGEKQAEYMRRIEKLRERLRDLKEDASNEDALTGGDGPSLGDALENTSHLANATEDWERKVHRLKLQHIEDRYEREKKLIDERYAHEIKKARDAGASEEVIGLIYEAHWAETSGVDLRRKWEREESAAGIQDRLEEARIRATRDGVDERLALLRREFHREMKEAAGVTGLAGRMQDQLRELYGLKARELLEGARGGSRRAVSVAGTFAAGALGGLGGQRKADRMIGELEDIRRHLRSLDERAARGRLVFSG